MHETKVIQDYQQFSFLENEQRHNGNSYDMQNTWLMAAKVIAVMQHAHRDHSCWLLNMEVVFSVNSNKHISIILQLYCNVVTCTQHLSTLRSLYLTGWLPTPLQVRCYTLAGSRCTHFSGQSHTRYWDTRVAQHSAV